MYCIEPKQEFTHGEDENEEIKVSAASPFNPLSKFLLYLKSPSAAIYLHLHPRPHVISAASPTR